MKPSLLWKGYDDGVHEHIWWGWGGTPDKNGWEPLIFIYLFNYLTKMMRAWVVTFKNATDVVCVGHTEIWLLVGYNRQNDPEPDSWETIVPAVIKSGCLFFTITSVYIWILHTCNVIGEIQIKHSNCVCFCFCLGSQGSDHHEGSAERGADRPQPAQEEIRRPLYALPPDPPQNHWSQLKMIDNWRCSVHLCL